MTWMQRSPTAQQRLQTRYRDQLAAWPVTYEQIRFPTCRGETFVLACGDPHAPPLVLFHGGVGNSLMWLRNARAWAEHFRVYCVDFIGEPGARPAFESDAYALWLDDVWRALSLREAAVAGWSLGGWLALDYAIRRPAGVGCLVALAPAGVVRPRRSAFFKVAPLMLMGAGGRRKALLMSMGLRDEPLSAEERCFIDFCLEAQTTRIGRDQPATVFSDDMLRSLKMPVLLVLGERDIFFDAAELESRFVSCVPHSRTCCLQEAGHGLMDPTQLVLDFLLP